ncbi:MAG: hypothetical protein AAF572_00875 [Cyanobacteria bacterium P01_B01_bin.77]
MVIVYVAIALFILIIIWLALQPKQGAKAANAPKERADDYDNPTYQLPTPQAEPPSTSKSLPQPQLPRVDYELPTSVLKPSATEKSNIQDQVRSLMQSNQKIAALKLVRSATGWSLKAAKAYVETYPNLAPLPLPHDATSPEVENSLEAKNLDDQIRNLLQKHQKVSAIKLVRATKGWDLKQAKDYVERFPNPAPFTASYNSTIASSPDLESFDIDRNTVNDRIQMLLAAGRKIEAIKLVRMVTNWSLKDSKEYIDNYPDVAPLLVTDHSPVSEKIQKLLSQSQYMDAITLVQSRTGLSVEDAKQYLEQTFECSFPF